MTQAQLVKHYGAGDETVRRWCIAEGIDTSRRTVEEPAA